MRTVGHYRIVEKLGEGGMGEVFLAEDSHLDRRVALKILPADFVQDPDRVRRFQKEARAASALSHPNILTIYEVGRDGEEHYIAAEYVDGDTLRKRMDDGPLDVDTVVDTGIAVASALAAAHDVSIIHRDVKPENVMIRSDGWVKVLDFGLAKLIEPKADRAKSPSTDPGKVLGTPQYMSPEQLRGVDIDNRSDIFALGALLYEMITGRVPFDGTTPEIIAGILNKNPAPPSRYASDLPEELERIVMKALRKDKRERYQTMRDLMLDLRSIKEEREFKARQRRISGDVDVEGLIDGRGTPTMPDDLKMLRSRTVSTDSLVFTRRERPLAWFALIGMVVVVIAALAWFTRPPRAIDSVAVLPFENVGGDPNTDYMAEGLTESIIHNLSRLSQLQVMARSTVYRYAGRKIDPQAVGKELNVRAVLTGRIIRRDNQLAIETELVDVERGTQLWGDRYNRPVDDLLRVQEEISDEISHKLRLRISGEDRKRVTKRHTASTEAYQEYLKGRYFWNRRNEDGLRKSIDFFQQAIERDPRYALAWAGLADTYILGPVYLGMPPADAMPRAKAAAERALAIDPDLAEAHCALAQVKFQHDWDWTGADREFRRAIELNPSYSTGHQWYALYLAAMGREVEARREIQKADALDPLSFIISTSIGTVHYLGHRYDEALAQFTKTLALAPAFDRTHFELARCYELEGDAQRAIAEFEKVKDVSAPVILAAKARAHAVAGDRATAEKLLGDLFAQGATEYVNPYDVAAVYTALGDRDQAFGWLDRAYREHVSRLAFLRVEPMFVPLHDDPRFEALAAKIGLPK
ncbi:MAG: protein kinase domain-containing protein [Thermoanaerobaculia bacterium]